LNRAKTNKEDFNLLLSRYGMERFLYRLSISPHNDRFILKGASLFLVWKGQNYRVTRDADFLGFGNADTEQLADVFRDICRVEFQRDGMIYLPESLNAEDIREDQEYDGVRITLVGMLNQARIPLQVDIGFGDAITPAPEQIEYPTFFDEPPPLLKAYPRYTLVAEKVEAPCRCSRPGWRRWSVRQNKAGDGLAGRAVMDCWRSAGLEVNSFTQHLWLILRGISACLCLIPVIYLPQNTRHKF